MKASSFTRAACFFIVAGLSVPAQAQLLGGVLGGGGDAGGGSSGGLISIDSGSAGSSSTINVGLGSGSGDSGHLASVNIGGTSANGLADVGVDTSNGVNANVQALGGSGNGGLTGNVNLLGSNGLLDVDVDLGDLEIDVGIGGPGGPGSPGGPGGPNALGGGSFGLTAADLACLGPDARSALERAGFNTQPSQWRRASNVRIVPIRLCPTVRAKVAAALRASGHAGYLQGAIQQDALINASLSRSSYNAGRVLGVQQNGRELTVYVY